MTPVTDPAILAQLNGPQTGPKPVTDPAILAQLNGEAPKGVVANAVDFAKSIPRGIMSNLASSASYAGESPVPPPDALMATTADKMAVLDKDFGLYKPQGRAGRFGEAAGGAIGNPLTYAGPSGLALKVGSSIAGALGSEGAGQATEGTAYEGPARIAGALAGGLAATKTLGTSAPKAVAPTYRELKDAAVTDYNAARNSGLELNPQGVASFASKVQQELSGPEHGFTGGQFGDAPKTFSVLDNLQNITADARAAAKKLDPTLDGAALDRVASSATVSASNLDAIRKNLGRLSRETVEGKPTADAAAASVALENLKGYTENIPQSHIVAGSAEDYVRATKQGNANYAAAQRVRTVDQKIARAQNNAEGGVATSIDNQIKSQVRTILNNEKAQRGYSPEEIAAMRSLNKGTVVSNTLRQVGRAGAGVIPLMMQGAAAVPAAMATGGASIIPQAAIAAGLYGARKTAEAMTKNRAQQLAEMLAKRSPLYQSRVGALPPADTLSNKAALARALLQVR